jgi:hypothetical protein
MKKRSLVFAALFSLSSSAAFAQPPPPPPPAPPPAAPAAGEADAHFRRGIDLYKEADFAAALIEFRRAYELDPKFQALYNIGETYFQLQDYANALKTLDKYLHDGGEKISAGRREEVQKEVDKLRTRVATIDVTTNVPDVDISVDDLPVGKTPLAAPLVVSAGRRKLTASKPGKPPISQVIELAGGDAKKVALVVPVDEVEKTEAPRKVPAAPWVITGVLGAGAIITGSLALNASSNLKGALAMVPGNAANISSDHSQTFALALTTDILVGCAIVAAGVSIYFTVSPPASKGGDKAAPPPPTARLSWPPLLSPQPPPPAGAFVRFEAGPQSARISGTF